MASAEAHGTRSNAWVNSLEFRFPEVSSCADVGRAIRETNISRDQQVGATVAGTAKDKVMAAGEAHASKLDAWGRNLAEAIPPEIPIIRPVLSGFF